MKETFLIEKEREKVGRRKSKQLKGREVQAFTTKDLNFIGKVGAPVTSAE